MKRLTFSIIFCCVLFLYSSVSAAGAKTPPDGWRYPTEKELAADNERRESSTKFAQATADFNGDGVSDRFGSAASLFYWDSKAKRFVRVWLSD